jgi:hypothetical protein
MDSDFIKLIVIIGLFGFLLFSSTIFANIRRKAIRKKWIKPRRFKMCRILKEHLKSQKKRGK